MSRQGGREAAAGGHAAGWLDRVWILTMFARGKRIAAPAATMHLQMSHEDPLPLLLSAALLTPWQASLAADDFSACLAGLRGDAAAKGVNGDTYSRYPALSSPT